jgi:HlyD family secretion protein
MTSARLPILATSFFIFLNFASLVSNGMLLCSIAHAESKSESKFDALIDPKLKPWIDRLHQGEMPSGIAKTNGRIEAAQIDVSAKYAGRLASVLVNAGDEVMAGQEIGRLSSPEYEAHLRGARAKELTAKHDCRSRGVDCAAQKRSQRDT